MNTYITRYFFVGLGIAIGVISMLIVRHWFSFSITMSLVIMILTSLFSLQGLFTLLGMLYAWDDPVEAEKHKSPSKYSPHLLTFTALVPANNEVKVIRDTICAISDINYPENLKETIVLCKQDDRDTVSEVEKTIKLLGKANIRLLMVNSFPVNKPSSLNAGLKVANNQIITIFDAEDQPHADIYSIVNTVMNQGNVDVVQSGVQLMNYRSSWFSSLNVLEYFFWFKSGLHYFSRVGSVVPLGGNTVFFKTDYVKTIGGWDEQCLTEDADLGVRLQRDGANVRVIYDELHVTREETPESASSFIRQRTRWNHGFLQILLKGDWRNLPHFRQKAMFLYLLAAPILQIGFLLYLPFGIWIAFYYKLPVIVSIFSFIPMYMFLLQIATCLVGIKEFTKIYKLNYSLWDSLKIVFVYIPYQSMIVVSFFRSVLHSVLKDTNWEKTLHSNAHRQIQRPQPSPSYAYAKNFSK